MGRCGRFVPARGLDFRDSWGNRIEIVDYRDIQFTKVPWILRGMVIGDLEKSAAAIAELEAKGLGQKQS